MTQITYPYLLHKRLLKGSETAEMASCVLNKRSLSFIIIHFEIKYFGVVCTPLYVVVNPIRKQ